MQKHKPSQSVKQTHSVYSTIHNTLVPHPDFLPLPPRYMRTRVLSLKGHRWSPNSSVAPWLGGVADQMRADWPPALGPILSHLLIRPCSWDAGDNPDHRIPVKRRVFVGVCRSV